MLATNLFAKTIGIIVYAVVFRKDLITLLLNRPMSLSQIARQIRQPLKDVEDDLQHLLKSLKHLEYVAVVTPGLCRKCGFEFPEEKLSKPSKCPKCHATWLTEPKVEIQAKGSSATTD